MPHIVSAHRCFTCQSLQCGGQNSCGKKDKGDKCTKCTKPVGEKEEGVQCEICQLWSHAKCVDVSTEL